jgi:O-antigen ligase
MAVGRGGTLFVDRCKAVFDDKPTLWINVARVSAIIAAVGVLYSPTVASVAFISTYVAFVASGQAVVRFTQVFDRPAVYWGVVFLGVVLLGVTYASAPWEDRWIDIVKWRTILWFFVLLSIFGDERWKVRLMVTFIVGAAVGLMGSFAVATGWVTLWRGPADLLRNYVTQGMTFAVAVLICLWMVLERRAQGRMRWLWSGLGVLFAFNVVFVTTSRSAYVVLGLGFSVLLLWNARPVQRLMIVLGLPVVVMLVLAISPRMQERITLGMTEWSQASESKDLTSMGLRRVYYLNTLEILQDHWLVGTGTGGFKQAYTEHVTRKYDPSDWRSAPIGDPHNQYLAVLVQHGIGGLAVFLVWIIAIARDKCGLPKYRKLALAILCGWCVTSLFSSHFRTFAEGHMLTTFLGALLSAPAMKDNSEVVSVSQSNTSLSRMLKKSASLSCSFGLFGLSRLSGLSRLFGCSVSLGQATKQTR